LRSAASAARDTPDNMATWTFLVITAVVVWAGLLAVAWWLCRAAAQADRKAAVQGSRRPEEPPSR